MRHLMSIRRFHEHWIGHEEFYKGANPRTVAILILIVENDG